MPFWNRKATSGRSLIQDHHHQTKIYNCEQQYTSQRYKLPDKAACKGQDG